MKGRIAAVFALLALVALVGPAFGMTSAHYAPKGGDSFSYNELVAVDNGTGTYQGYTESTTINGSLSVSSVLPNGTASASYYNLDLYQNNSGGFDRSTNSGTFTFSATTFLYVYGTDGQVGYTNPYVWFFTNNSLPVGSHFFVLNSEVAVVSTNVSYNLGTAAGSYVKTIEGAGTGSYARNDSYGVFTAAYTWDLYFDPTTGYIVGYSYVEHDTDTSGDSFWYTDSLSVTRTSYALTPDSAPPTPSTSTGSTASPWLTLVVVVIVVVVVLAILAFAISRARRRPSLPRHSSSGQVSFMPPPPMGPPPPGIHLSPSGQPMVQQIVVKETVKVNCRYCGALIDTTAEKCPFCGAARN